MRVMNKKRPTAVKGTMNHAKTSFSTEIFAGATIHVVRYLAPLRYAVICCRIVAKERLPLQSPCLLSSTTTAALLQHESPAAPSPDLPSALETPPGRGIAPGSPLLASADTS
jgi:hypothetical protein